MTSAFSWQNSISLCPASFCTPRPNLPVTPGVSWVPTFAFQSCIMKGTSFLGVLKGLVDLHRTIQLKLSALLVINYKLKREKVYFYSPSFSLLLLRMWRWWESSCSKLSALRGHFQEGREREWREPRSQVKWDCYTSPQPTTGPLLHEVSFIFLPSKKWLFLEPWTIWWNHCPSCQGI